MRNVNFASVSEEIREGVGSAPTMRTRRLAAFSVVTYTAALLHAMHDKAGEVAVENGRYVNQEKITPRT
jgi:hypothetical protein